MSLQEYEQWFRSVDTDNSGSISYDELKKALGDKGYSEAQLQKMFHVMDISEDGMVTFDEYLKTMGVQPQDMHTASVYKRMCWSFDKNGDGKIDREELLAVFKSIGQHVDQAALDRMVASFDVNGDGVIDYNEFCLKLFGTECV